MRAQRAGTQYTMAVTAADDSALCAQAFAAGVGDQVALDPGSVLDALGEFQAKANDLKTGQKIVADLADRFVCIADESKWVQTLGQFPLPVEVIQMAVPQVMRRFEALGGKPQVRAGVLTDNGHPIVDVRGLHITDPRALEIEINQWPGVVTVGIFARHRASVCLLGTAQGVRTITL